jgi:hypothetical protein
MSPKETRYLYILADAVHLFKNLKQSLETNKIFVLSPEIQTKYSLPSQTVEYAHFVMLMDIDQKDCLKLAPQLAKTTLTPNTFQKMNVHTSKKVINYETASALDYLSDEQEKPELKTTAWFTIMAFCWFQLMTSTSLISALSHKNEESYQNAISHLNEFMYIIRNIKVGNGYWKPWQRGILVTTTGVLELQSKYLDECGFDFFLTSHLTSNCIENIFSLLRLKHKVMNALQFKQDLKQLQLSKFFKPVNTSSYDLENFVGLSETFEDFCTTYRKNLAEVPKKQQLDLPSQLDIDLIELDLTRLNVLFYIVGYILQSVQLNFVTCQKCFDGVIVPKYVARHTELTRKREMKEGSLIYCSNSFFVFFEVMEKLFRAALNHIPKINKGKLIELFNVDHRLRSFNFPICHDLKNKIIKRFALFRLRIELDHLNRTNKKYEAPAAAGSKSVAQNMYTQNTMSGCNQKM